MKMILRAQSINFSSGTRDLILQPSPLHQYGSMLSILNPPVALRCCNTTGCPIDGETRVPTARCRLWMVVERSENHLLPWLRRPAPKVIQSGPIRVLRQQMFKDQIRAGVQFKKIDGQHNQEKISVKQAQALSIYSPTFSAKLDVNVTQEGSGWGLWQSQSSLWTPMRFWSQVWHGAE